MRARSAPHRASRPLAGIAACLVIAVLDCPAEAQGPAAKAAPAIVPAEPGATTATFADWVLRCQRTGEGEKAPRICEVAQSLQVQGQAAPIAQVAIGRVRGEPLRVTVVLPASVAFPSGVHIQLGEARPGEKSTAALELAWRRCLSGGCFAEANPGEEVLKRWRSAGEPGRITLKDAADREVVLPLSFRGLAQALDALAKEAP